MAILPQNFDAINVSREGKKRKERKKREKKKKEKKSFGIIAPCARAGPNSIHFQRSQRFANADLEVKQLVGCI